MSATPTQQLPEHAGERLLMLARTAIAAKLGQQVTGTASEPWLEEKGACFITLMQNGRLRGCIGSLEAHRPLRMDVMANAVAAAFHDPRFKPLTPDEFPVTRVEVSLLSPLQPMSFTDEADALQQLQPGTDGLVFQYGFHRSTFLPQVWEQFPERGDFMAHLKQKAGLPPDFWDPQVKLSRYFVTKWRENEAARAGV